MCEYCEGKYGSELLIKGNESVFIDVSKTRLELVKATRDGYGLVTFDSQKINYCPVCGRKLNKDNWWSNKSIAQHVRKKLMGKAKIISP